MGLKSSIKQRLQNVKRSLMSKLGLLKSDSPQSVEEVNHLITQIQEIDSEHVPKVATLIDIESIGAVKDNNIKNQQKRYYDNLNYEAESDEDEGYDCIDGKDQLSDRNVLSLQSVEYVNDKTPKSGLLCDTLADAQTTGFEPQIDLDGFNHLQFTTRCVDDYAENHPEGIENAFVPFEVIGQVDPPQIDIDKDADETDAQEDVDDESDQDMDIIELLHNTAKAVRVSRADKIGQNGRFRMTAGDKLSAIRFVRPIHLK